MRAESASLNHCTVPFLSSTGANLCWYYYILNLSSWNICILQYSAIIFFGCLPFVSSFNVHTKSHNICRSAVSYSLSRETRFVPAALILISDGDVNIIFVSFLALSQKIEEHRRVLKVQSSVEYEPTDEGKKENIFDFGVAEKINQKVMFVSIMELKKIGNRTINTINAIKSHYELIKILLKFMLRWSFFLQEV